MSFPFSRTVGAGIHIVSLSDINILCDTSAGAVNLILPKITDAINFSQRQGNGIGGFGSGNFTLNITDIGNNASVNNIVITKNASDSFANNLSSVVINTNNGSVGIKPITESSWSISFTYSASGGGGGVIVEGIGTGSSERCGNNNNASGNCSTVSGGERNCASNSYSTISGGYCNTASNNYSFVGGGAFNCASGAASIVSGGRNNTASAYYSTVSGGYANQVQ